MPFAGSVADPESIGSIRLGRLPIASRQALVAIVYSHERSELRRWNRGSARQARSSASCTASSASWTDASIR